MKPLHVSEPASLELADACQEPAVLADVANGWDAEALRPEDTMDADDRRLLARAYEKCMRRRASATTSSSVL